MPRGSKPGERRGGRKKGVTNRNVVERRLLIKNVTALMQEANGVRRLNGASSDEEARAAMQEIANAKAKQVPLAKDALATFLGIFMSRAGYYNTKGINPDTKKDINPNANEDKFNFYAGKAVEVAKALAPYQSPTYRAVIVTPPPATDSAPRRFTLSIHDASNGKTAFVQTNLPASPPIIDAIADEVSESASDNASDQEKNS